jgi:hypothetical protein
MHALVRPLLLQHGAPADVQDDEGDTPLHYALREGSVSAVAALLEHGADPALPNFDLEAPLHFASLVRSPAASQGSLQTAYPHTLSQYPQVDVDLVRGLLKAGAKLCATDATEATPLHWAAEVGAGSVLTALLEAGAQSELRDVHGHMALAYALDCGVEDVVLPLLYTAANDMDSILSLHLDTACTLDSAVSDITGNEANDASGVSTGHTARAFGEGCHNDHSWTSCSAPMTPLTFAPLGLSDLSSSPASSFAAFAPVALRSPRASSGFFPPLGASSYSMAAF